MFETLNYHIADSKGRVAIPSPYREAMEANGLSSLRMTNSLFSDCINFYLPQEWDRLCDRFNRLPPSDRVVEAFMRYIYAPSRQVTWDASGRILIPDDFRLRFNLVKEVVFAPFKTYFELWNREAWDATYVGARDLLRAERDKVSNVIRA